MKGTKIIKLLGAAAALGAGGLLWWLERRRPLRRAVEPKLTRQGRNLTIAALSAVALQLCEPPVAQPLTQIVERKKLGLLKIRPLPPVLETVLAIVLLDYTLYLWHVLTHKVPFLWRFHLVHHVDLDLDASTALRFHFAEIMVSVVWRAAQILVIGITPRSFAVWQAFLFPSILFHHANLRLPLVAERKLQNFIVTPRLHGIHHSCEQDETNSNWSSGLTLWDKLHGTFRADVPQNEIVIGVPAYHQPDAVTLGKILTLPFHQQKPAWPLPPAIHPSSENQSQ